MNLSAVNVVSGKAVIDFICLSRIDDKGEVDPPFGWKTDTVCSPSRQMRGPLSLSKKLVVKF